MEDYRRIETAPRDGSIMLLHNSRINRTFVGGWSENVSGLNGLGGWTDVGSENAAESCVYNPHFFDYWLPLPPSPTPAESP